MKRSGWPQLSYEQALAKKIAADEKRRNKPPKSIAEKERKKQARKRARARKNEHARLEGEWKFQVRKKYDYTCQYPSCTVKDEHIDCHHVNPRSQRKDLIYVVSNGKTLCRFHHDWVSTHREEALLLDLLRERSYEIASKEGTLGIR